MYKKNNGWYRGKHLGMIFIIGLFYFLFTILVAGSTNTVFPILSELNSWDNSKILVALTFSGYIGAFSILFLSKIVMRRGAKLVAVICVATTACLVACWGIISNLALFITLLLILRVFITGFQGAAGPALVSAWFPKTKGIMLGFATMGIPLSDIIWGPYIPDILMKFGSRNTFFFVSGCYAVFCTVIIVFVKNTPEEAGTWPDGIRPENRQTQTPVAHPKRNIQEKYNGYWTVKRVLTTKESWLIILGWGLLWLSATLFLNQIVPNILSLGYSRTMAIRILQTSAIGALAGSYILGALDSKLNPKTASQILAVWSIIMFTLSLFMGKSFLLTWIVPICIMAGVGGICNLIPSTMISIWGRFDFVPVNRVISCIHLLITSSGFAVIALFTTSKSGFTGLHILSLILSVISLVLISSLKLKPLECPER